MKYAVFDLYPLPMLASGQCWVNVLLLTRLKKAVEVISTGCALLLIANLVSWTVIVARFLWLPS